MWRRCAIGAVAACALVSGCGQVIQGTARPAERPQPAWHPCSIPDDAIRAVGADPKTKDVDIAGVQLIGWNFCSWTQGDGTLVVLSSDVPMDEVRTKKGVYDIHPIALAGRGGAFTHLFEKDLPAKDCYVTFAAGGGTTVEVVVRTYDPPQGGGDTCAEATRSATGLNGVIPT